MAPQGPTGKGEKKAKLGDPLRANRNPKFVSPSLDWLAWLGLARLASAWLVSSAAATTTATQGKPSQASQS